MKKIYLLLSLLCIIFVHIANAQNRQITGVVTSADDGSTIPGVSVIVKDNPTIGALTDVDGKFQLTVPPIAKTLLFSSVGMEKLEVAIGSSNVIDVKLVPVATNLDEIVVNYIYLTISISCHSHACCIICFKLWPQSCVRSFVCDTIRFNVCFSEFLKQVLLWSVAATEM